MITEIYLVVRKDRGLDDIESILNAFKHREDALRELEYRRTKGVQMFDYEIHAVDFHEHALEWKAVP